jgi:serine/threonine-protein kinase
MRRAALGVGVAADLFEQAIAKDPSFAPAYAGLASMEAAESAFDRFTLPERAAMIAKGWTAAEKAIQLDSRLADAHDALGMMQARQAQWRQAEHSFRRAIELSPRDPLWRNHFAEFLLMPLDRIEEAIKQLRSAEELDPGSRDTQYALSLALRAAGRFDEANGACQRSGENDRHKSECWAEMLLHQGKPEEAVRTMETFWNGHLFQMGAEELGVAYARAGRREDAERIAAGVPRPSNKAPIFAALGDRDRTLGALEQMVQMGPTRLGRDLIAPEYRFLQNDPRLNALRRRTGLPALGSPE